jgi:sugar diacid utilization regulator
MVCIVLIIFIVDAVLISIQGNQHIDNHQDTEQQITYSDGRDVALFIGNGKFQIIKVEDYALCEHSHNDRLLETLLSYVQKYKQIDNKVYIISEEGYAIIDSNNNTGKLLIAFKKQRCYSTDHLTVTVDDLEGVTILKSYKDFTKEEKDVFEKLEKHWWYGHTFHYTHNLWDD